MKHRMTLTEEEEALLEGSQGDVMRKIMTSMVLYGDAFDAERLVPVTSDYGHLVTSFGLSVLKPVYRLLDELIEAGIASRQKFTVDPRPLDFKQVPCGFLSSVLFKVMYSKQDDYEAQLRKLGLLSDQGFTCACYMDEVGNTPVYGDVLSWAESSAVVYANSVLGARSNRNSGIFELFGSILGKVPYFGFLTDEGRRASWIVEIKTRERPEAQLLGSAIGMKVVEDVPYIKNLDRFLGRQLTEDAKNYLKDMGAATASNGAVGLYHVDGLTPEAVKLGESLIRPEVRTYVVDDAELARVKAAYPLLWKNRDTKPSLCFIGCPHNSLRQFETWCERLEAGLKAAALTKVAVPTVMTGAPQVVETLKTRPAYAKLAQMGVKISSICPLMYMNNPICAKKPVITNSNKLRTYSTARYYQDDEILSILCKGGK